MGLIKFLFFTILILWIIRLLLKLIFPLVVKSIFGKMQQSSGYAGQQQQQQQQRQSNRPEGSLSIDYVPPQPKQGNADKLGDFVDYEEVK
ncbi:DUF4834 family protein [Pedobacter sp. NJ-S-72]